MDLTHLNVSIWTVIAWAIATAWFAVVVVFTIAFRKQSLLRPLRDCIGIANAKRLSVIVAARNESACIENCIRSLFRQDYPDMEVIAVNDRSTDDTAQILDRLAIQFPGRLRVIHVSYLPTGWFGKPHALTLGLQSATGELVCFTDADCEFQAPSAMRTAVAELFHKQLDFLSIAARYTMTSLRECVAVPCCSEVLVTWLHPERVSDPKWPDAFANGAFVLVRKEPFNRIGGWGAVRTKISEDLELARLAKKSGLKIALIQGEGFYQTSSYATTKDSWNGWSRIFKGALTPAQLIITVGRMFCLFVLPLVAMLWTASSVVFSGTPEWLPNAAIYGFAVAFGLRCLLDVAMFRLSGSPIASAALAPLGRLFVMAAAIRALLSHAGLVNTHWRGTAFSAGQLVTVRRAGPEPQIP